MKRLEVIMKSENDFEFLEQLSVLLKKFGKSTDPNYKSLIELTKQAQDGRRNLEKSLLNLQESLDYLRIVIKYMVFDLEATRRENEVLRQIIAGKHDEDDVVG